MYLPPLLLLSSSSLVHLDLLLSSSSLPLRLIFSVCVCVSVCPPLVGRFEKVPKSGKRPLKVAWHTVDIRVGCIFDCTKIWKCLRSFHIYFLFALLVKILGERAFRGERNRSQDPTGGTGLSPAALDCSQRLQRGAEASGGPTPSPTKHAYRARRATGGNEEFRAQNVGLHRPAVRGTVGQKC